MYQGAICFLLRGEKGKEEVCLARKLHGLGEECYGKDFWNGYGGKARAEESMVECALREASEEAAVSIDPRALIQKAVVVTHRGVIPFFELHVFIAIKWDGDPKETSEMGPPAWFPVWNLPFEDMFPDDHSWLPTAITGEPFNADVYLSERGEMVTRVVFSEPRFTEGPA